MPSVAHMPMAEVMIIRADYPWLGSKLPDSHASSADLWRVFLLKNGLMLPPGGRLEAAVLVLIIGRSSV